jgi:arylsulfatase A-like enzyme
VLLAAACTNGSTAGGTGLSSGSPTGTVGSGPPGPVETNRPNIIFILTDDQRWDELSVMPTVQRELVGHGVTFTNSFVVNPACCPSRASILTGDYSHTTGIYKNNPPDGGFESFKDSSTVATWLHGAGYRTALVGKYLNGYSVSRARFIPPGWDAWNAFTLADSGSGDGKGGYFGYGMSVNGRETTYGSGAQNYSTDVLRRYATDFILHSSPGKPLFLYFAPRAPHSPATPPPRYRAACPDLKPFRPPSFNEPDVSDKPSYVRAFPPADVHAVDEAQRRHCQALLGVDDAVQAILEALRQTGRLSNSLIVFASDNGVQGGEHRIRSKYVPYEESIRVPLVIRYDRMVKARRSDGHLVLNIDYAPTFAATAGAGAPGAEGRSLLPLLEGSTVAWRSDFLVEHIGAVAPPFCEVRTERYMYTAYATGEEELYDLKADPFELSNRARDPALASTLRSLRARDRVLCRPTPPGFSFPS